MASSNLSATITKYTLSSSEKKNLNEFSILQLETKGKEAHLGGVSPITPTADVPRMIKPHNFGDQECYKYLTGEPSSKRSKMQVLERLNNPSPGIVRLIFMKVLLFCATIFITYNLVDSSYNLYLFIFLIYIYLKL